MGRFSVFFCLILWLMATSIFNPKTEAASIRIGVLPVVESLPFLAAQQSGLFHSSGLKVEIVSFSSALERDSAVQSGAIHGAIHDILGLSLLRSKDIPFTIVTNMTVPTSKRDLFVLLAPPGSGMKGIEELRGKEIGLSSHTIAEYVTDCLLSLKGLKVDEVKKVEVKKIPLRFQMLMESRVKAATLPEPLASLAIFQGAKKLGGDYGLKGTQVVLVFQESFIRAETETMIRLGKVYWQAIRMINEDPQRWRQLLVEKGRLPSPIKDIYTLNPFSDIQVPRPEEIQVVKAWMEGKGFETSKITYSPLVNDVWVKGVR